MTASEQPSFAISAPLMERLGANRPGLPVCLVTGFLGAGKTTLVNHILTNSQGVRAAVFVNEYGSVDVDGALIRWQGAVDEDNIVSLTNGCVCCEVNGDLAKQLARILRTRRDALDVLIIETSGVCDPEPVIETIRQVEDVDGVHLDSVVCVVDCTTVSDVQLGGSPDARRQLMHADVLLLNKVDLLPDAAAVAAVELKVLGMCELPPHAVLRTVRGEVDLQALCGFRSSVSEAELAPKRRCLDLKRIWHRSGHSASADQFVTFAYVASRPFDMLRFEEWAQTPPAGVLRAKGLLWVRGVPRYVAFHLAGRRTNPFETLARSEVPTSSEIVFIGHSGVGTHVMNEQRIKEELDRCLF